MLAPLRGRDGRVNTYSLTDVVALAVVHPAVGTAGIAVSHIGVHAIGIWEAVHNKSLTGQFPFYFFVHPTGATYGEPTDLPQHDLIMTARIDLIAADVAPAIKALPDSSQSTLL